MKKSENLNEIAAKRTSAKILESAQKVFIRSGFSGSSMADIAKGASVNQSLIYHYFANKEELWRQVKLRMIENLCVIDSQDDMGEGSLSDFLKKIVQKRFQMHEQNPDLMRMLLWQSLEKDSSGITGTDEGWSKRWLKKIEELKKNKKLVSPLSSEEIFVLLNGIVWAPFIFNPFMGTESNGQSFCEKVIDLLQKAFNPDYNASR